MGTLWTVSRGPIAASHIDVEKADAINSLLLRPIGILPAVPGEPIRPFAIGLFEELRQLLKPEIGVTTLRRAVGAFVHSKRYYFASAQPDAMRHTIDGEPVEPLSVEDRLVAQNRLLNLKRKNEQSAAETTMVPDAEVTPSKSEKIRAGLLSRSRHSSDALS